MYRTIAAAATSNPAEKSLPDAVIRFASPWGTSYATFAATVSINDLVVGGIELHATVRPEAKATIEGLRQRGIKSIYIISGDHAAPTKNLATSLGIDHYYAEVLPEDTYPAPLGKAYLIEKLQKEGKKHKFRPP